MVKGVSETINNEANEQGVFLSMLFGTLVASLLTNLLTSKATIREGESAIRAGEGTIRADQNF